MTSSIFDHEPDVIYTEKEAVDEGTVRLMDGWGIATFRGEPVRTVSDNLFRALKDAFGLAASAGLNMTGADWEETLAERADEGLPAPDISDLDGRTGLVPPSATLGDLLQILITGAADTAKPGEPHDWLYRTPPVKAIGDEEIWRQRPAAGHWTAFLPGDY